VPLEHQVLVLQVVVLLLEALTETGSQPVAVAESSGQEPAR
jgi:hypothetical protein